MNRFTPLASTLLWPVLTLPAQAQRPTPPSDDNGRHALQQMIDKGSTERVALRTFRKTDGLMSEWRGGTWVYQLEFEALGEFLTNVWYQAPDITSHTLTTMAADFDGQLERGCLSGRISFGCPMSSIGAAARAWRGDTALFTGTVYLVRMESGWRTELATLSKFQVRRATAPRVDPFAETPLGAASRTGDVKGILALIRSGADVNRGYGYKASHTPLMAAARNGHLEAVKILVQAGARLEPSEDASGLTALGMAATAGYLDIVRSLIAAGASLKGGGDYDPIPPLRAAATAGKLDVVRILLQAGADPAERFRGTTALEAAREANQGQVVAMLDNSKASMIADPIAPEVAVEAFIKGSQFGEFRHGTRVVGCYTGGRLTDIVLASAKVPTGCTQVRRLVHAGLDIIAKDGAAVHAPFAGTVVDVVSTEDDANWNSLGYASFMRLDERPHGRDLFAAYLHLREAPRHRVGQRVEQGDLIGTIGSTGAAFGAHLHFELRFFPGRFHPAWGNIYGRIGTGGAPGTFEEKAFVSDWLDPELFLRRPE